MTDRSAELERFYGAHAEQVRRAVAANVTTSDETVLEDACQHAWTALVRRHDITLDERGVAWLATVASREGWRLARPRRDVPSGAIRGTDPDPLELPEPAAPGRDPEEHVLARIEHQQRFALLRELALVERRVVVLQALGLAYAEIAAATALSPSTVNSKISRARSKLRQEEAARR